MTRPVLLGVGITLTVLCSLFPVLWFILTSLKSQVEVEAVPPTWWPSGDLGFYHAALIDHHLFDYILNSLMVAGATTVLTLAIGTPAAYALARLRLRGRCGFSGACWVSPCFLKSRLRARSGAFSSRSVA